MRFLIDANLPPALADWLAAAGHDALHVDDILAAPALDDAIWRVASSDTRILVTKDADFVLLAERQPGPQVVWIRCGNLTLTPFRAWFLARAPAMIALLDLGEIVVELR